MIIRPATAEDVPLLVRLRQAFWASQLDSGLKDRRDLTDAAMTAETQRLVTRPRTCVLLGTVDAEPAGYVVATLQAAPHLTPPVVKVVEEIFVTADVAGSGLGARLATQAFATLLPDTPAREQIRVLAGNARGRAFWRRLGFEDAVLIMEREQAGPR